MKDKRYLIIAVGLFVSLVFLATVNLLRPDITGIVERSQKSFQELAAACYYNGFERGRLTEVAERAKAVGVPLSKAVQASLAQNAPAGCDGKGGTGGLGS